MSEFWQNKIKAFLHDPPDKALILCTGGKHEKFAAELWKYLGLEQDAKILETQGLRHVSGDIHTADIIASTMQRLDLPRELRGFTVCFTKRPRQAMIKHTISGREEKTISGLIAIHGYNQLRIEKWNNGNVIEFLKKLKGDNWNKTYFLLWRFLPEEYQIGYLLPADTRIPDHSIWDHLDVTAAIFSCLEEGLCLFAVKIPAVQEFISHSRKLADLWAASHIFSNIAFEGIKVIIEELGPDVIIYPQLRGNPMVDLTEFNGENGNFVLYDEGQRLNILEENPKKRLHIANFPNTFLAFIPASRACKIAEKVEEKIRSKWQKIAKKAKELLRSTGILIDEELWNQQISNAIEVTSVWLQFFNFDKFNNVKESIPDDLKERQENWLNLIEEVDRKSNFGHFYSLTYEILSAVLTQKSRFWNAWEEEPITGKKCLMCGRRNALVERFRDEKSNKEFYQFRDEKSNKEFYQYWLNNKWENKPIEELGEFRYLLKEGERLCAVCLTKRLYGWRTKSVFEKIYGVKSPKQESVVHVAARDFIENFSTHPILRKIIEKDIELIYEHEWGESEDRIPEEKRSIVEELKKELEKSWKELRDKVKESYERFGKPNKYYAILMMDGDRIGKWLSGERWKENDEEKGLPDLEEFLHPIFRDKIKEWKEDDGKRGEELIKTKRILTPSHHIAISRAMKDFSLYKVPEIVEKFNGFLVYAGGDDVLALFPADKVLDAACEIQKFFKEDFYEIEVNSKKRKVMGLGNRASMSAGIVFAHYKWPLYDAIERVRKAEKEAKEKYGRNALCMIFIKRSGEVLTAGGKWDSKNYFDKILELLSPEDEEKRKLSHRFVHDFLDVCRKLKKDNKWKEPYISMLKAEVKRLLERRNYKSRLTEKDRDDLHEEIFSPLIDDYVKKQLPLEDIGMMLRILYDAYRGEER